MRIGWLRLNKRALYIFIVLLFSMLIDIILSKGINIISFGHIIEESFLFFWIALAAAIIISQSKIDISYFGQIPFIGMLVLIFQILGFNIALNFILVFIIGIAVNLIEYLFVKHLPGWSLIVSLAVGFLLSGLAIFVDNAYLHNNKLLCLMNDDVIGFWKSINMYTIIIPIFIIVWIKCTYGGLKFLAAGENENGAKIIKINVNSNLKYAYLMSAILTIVGSLDLIVRMNHGVWKPNIGEGEELLAIAVVIIGGSTLSGGTIYPFSIFGASTIYVIWRKILNIHLNNPDQYRMALGVILVAIIAYKAFSRRKQNVHE